MNELYKAIEAERNNIWPLPIKKDISKQIGKNASDGNYIWESMKKGTIRMCQAIEIANILGMEFYLTNEEGQDYYIKANNRSFYNCIEFERKESGYSNLAIAELIGATSSRGYAWQNIKDNYLKYNDAVTICNELDLKIWMKAKNSRDVYVLNDF